MVIKIKLVVTRACKAQHGTKAAMAPDDDPWNPKGQRHFAISESHDYVSYFLEWPILPRRKRKYVPIVPNRARTHAFPSLWGASVNEWMNEWKMPSGYHTGYAPLT
jgi:hypothetical protein